MFSRAPMWLSTGLERIIVNSIFDHLSDNAVLSCAQHGFVSRRSTRTNLLKCDWTVSPKFFSIIFGISAIKLA